MNREQIEKAAKNFIEDFCYDHIDYTSINCEEDNYEAARNNTLCEFGADIFSAGADWRINSVWHNASEEQPEAGKPYLAVIELPQETKYAVWEGYANHPFWKKWAYISDLLPDRKEVQQ